MTNSAHSNNTGVQQHTHFQLFLYSLLFSLSLLTLPLNVAPQRLTRPSQYVDSTRHVMAAGKQRLDSIEPQQPQQLLLAVSGRQDEMVVQWVTYVAAQLPHVVCLQAHTLFSDNDSIASSLIRIYANTTIFHNPADSSITRYIYNALITGLQSNTRYVYRVGDFHHHSEWQSFVTLPSASSLKPVTLAVYGDLGVANSQSMKFLQREVVAETVNVIVHVGDFAYDLFSDRGRVGDIFMDELSRRQLSSRVPYMGCSGNHEALYNFSHYTHRFHAYEIAAKNSGSNTNRYFAWEYVSGGARVMMIAIDSQVYFHDDPDLTADGAKQLANLALAQYHWLSSTLQAARQSNQYDWIIVYGHRPMYCSNSLEREAEGLQLRRGGAEWNGKGLEELLNDYKVDLYFSGHDHSYERLFPVYNDTHIDLNHDNHTYINPLYTTHVIAGSAGCDEQLEPFYIQQGAWSVIRSETYGYGKMTVYNATHLYWQQLLDEGRQGTDELWIIKETDKSSFKHNPYSLQ